MLSRAESNHDLNTFLPMLETLRGIVTLLSLVQSANAKSPMLVTLSGRFMLVRPQPSNALAPMLVTPSGMVTSVMPLQ